MTTISYEHGDDHRAADDMDTRSQDYGVGLGAAGKAGVERNTAIPAVPAVEAPGGSPPAPDAPTESTIPQDVLNRLADDIVTALKSVYDPEIPVDIYELGLIYKVDINNDYSVDVDMSLTAPGCPVAGEMPIWVQNAVESVEGIKGARVQLTFDPPWDPSRMSDEARFALDFW